MGKRRRKHDVDDEAGPKQKKRKKNKKKRKTKEKNDETRNKKINNVKRKRRKVVFDRNGIMSRMREKHRKNKRKIRQKQIKVMGMNDDDDNNGKKIQISRDERALNSLYKKHTRDISIMKRAIRKTEEEEEEEDDDLVQFTKKQCLTMLKTQKLIISNLKDIFSRFKKLNIIMEKHEQTDKFQDKIFFSLYDHLYNENTHSSYFSLNLNETGVDLLSTKMCKT